jgi:anti-anti-sigma factor
MAPVAPKEGSMTAAISQPSLRLVRLPGEFGPIVRCYGELVKPTVTALQQELAVLEPLDHPAVTLNLCGCVSLDSDGVMAILQSYKRRRERGWQLVVVASPGRVAHVLQLVGFDRVVPVFRSEDAVGLTLRGGPLPPAPASWAEALSETVLHWRETRQALDHAPKNEVVRLLTSMTALCERSEECFRDGSRRAAFHCEFCPLFHRLGGRPEDAGCMSMLDPIIAAVRSGDQNAARTQVRAAARTLEEMCVTGSAGSYS